MTALSRIDPSASSSFSRSLNEMSVALQVLLALILITAYTALTYYDITQNTPHEFQGDDLTHIEYVKDNSPLAPFYQRITVDDLYYTFRYYRPMFVLQTWALYHLFGVNFDGYLLVSFAVHILSALTLFFVFRAITKDFLISLLLATIYVGHPYVRELIWYVSDSAGLTTLLLGVTLILLLRFKDHAAWYIGLLITLILIPLSRENGLAVNAGVVGYAIYGWYKQLHTRRQSLLMIGIAVSAVILYALLRLNAAPIGQDTISINEGGFLFDKLNFDQVNALSPQRKLLLAAYYWVASIIAIVLPLFREQGYITISYALVTLVIVWFGLLTVFTVMNWSKWSHTTRYGILGVGVLLGIALPAAAIIVLHYDPVEFLLGAGALRGESLIFGLHALAAICTLYYMGAHWSALTVEHRALIVFAIIMSVLSASLGFAYFRHRHLRYALAGLLMCLAIVHSTLPATSVDRIVRSSARIFSTLLAAVILIAALPY